MDKELKMKMDKVERDLINLLSQKVDKASKDFSTPEELRVLCECAFCLAGSSLLQE